MRCRKGGTVAVSTVLVLALAGCQKASEEVGRESEIATVESVEGMDVARVTLSEDAAARLDIQTAPVEALHGGAEGKAKTTIPYAAVLYDPNGDTWAYTSPEPFVFVRAPIRVVYIDGDEAGLSEGPPPGTQVVIVGAAELLGSEYKVGEE